MPEALFQEWTAFYLEEPFGNSWRQTGRLCMLLQNVNAGKGRRMKEEEFMPQRPPTQLDGEAFARMLMMQHGARPVEKTKNGDRRLD